MPEQPTTYAAYQLEVLQAAQQVHAALRMDPERRAAHSASWPELAGALDALDDALQRPVYAERSPG
jgi:hypothetical protein